MEAIRQIISVKDHSATINLPIQDKEYKIPQWQIEQVRERTKKYLKNPENTTDIDDFLNEIEDNL